MKSIIRLRFLSSLNGILKAVVKPKMNLFIITADDRSPHAGAVQGYSRTSCFGSGIGLAISAIIQVRDITHIHNAIIVSATVYMVKLASGPKTIVMRESNSVSQKQIASDVPMQITVFMARGQGGSPGIHSVPSVSMVL
jgi:hypothetical protein